MKLNISVLTIFVFIVSFCNAQFDVEGFLGGRQLTTRRVVEEILLYFQQDDPHGIPVLTVPDPLSIPGTLDASPMTLTNVTIHGHSQLRLEHVGINLEELKVDVRISVPNLQVLSKYVWPGYFFGGSSVGDMNITLTYLEIGITAYIGVDEEGLIEVVDLTSSIYNEEFFPHFTGLGGTHQALVSAADSAFSSLVAPAIESRLSGDAIDTINQQLRMALSGRKFPADISPVDFVIAGLRKNFAHQMNLDPFLIKERELDLPIPVTLMIKNGSVEGLSTVHRDKDISIEFIDNTIYVNIEARTRALTLTADWSLYSSVFPLGDGHAIMSIDGLGISVHLRQDADIRHPPIIRNIDIELGNLALRSFGERNLDYVLEAAVNIFPNIFKNIFMDRKVEGLIKEKIQEEFNSLDLEAMLQSQLNIFT